MKEFTAIAPTEIDENIFSLIGTSWFLLTADTETINPMTASWGTAGILWHKPVVTVFVRPQRFTYGLMERSEYYSLSFFTEEHRSILKYCGSHSGNDVDKIAETGLTPITTPNGSTIYRESFLAVECKKIFSQDMDPNGFIDQSINDHYAKKDYHRMYTGEIISVYSKK